jgi:hypothetical protein
MERLFTEARPFVYGGHVGQEGELASWTPIVETIEAIRAAAKKSGGEWYETSFP